MPNPMNSRTRRRTSGSTSRGTTTRIEVPPRGGGGGGSVRGRGGRGVRRERDRERPPERGADLPGRVVVEDRARVPTNEPGGLGYRTTGRAGRGLLRSGSLLRRHGVRRAGNAGAIRGRTRWSDRLLEAPYIVRL